MHVAPLVIAGVAVLAVAGYMMFVKSEEIEREKSLSERSKNGQMTQRQKEFASCMAICKDTFSMPGERDSLNLCIVKCNY